MCQTQTYGFQLHDLKTAVNRVIFHVPWGFLTVLQILNKQNHFVGSVFLLKTMSRFVFFASGLSVAQFHRDTVRPAIFTFHVGTFYVLHFLNSLEKHFPALNTNMMMT